MTAPPNAGRIPPPARPGRREPLPWHRPKPSQEDEAAPAEEVATFVPKLVSLRLIEASTYHGTPYWLPQAW